VGFTTSKDFKVFVTLNAIAISERTLNAFCQDKLKKAQRPTEDLGSCTFMP
jgi:hypothetical protein